MRNVGGFTMRVEARISSRSRSITIDEALFVVLDVDHKAFEEEEAVIASHASTIWNNPKFSKMYTVRKKVDCQKPPHLMRARFSVSMASLALRFPGIR